MKIPHKSEIQDLVEDAFAELKHNDRDGAKMYFLKIAPFIDSDSVPERIKNSYVKTVKAFDTALTNEILDCQIGSFSDELRRRQKRAAI